MVGFCVVLYLFLGILNFCMLDDVFNDVFNDINILFEKRWLRILFRLSWIFIWPLYILFAILSLIGLAMFTFFEKLVK